jgi:tetratricopeptide (TPR) repeat protein
LAEGGKTELARRVLDWARDALAKDEGRRDAHAALFASIWNGDPERVRLAAAVAAADGPRSARAVPVLAESVKTANAALRDRLKVALGLAQVTSKDADVALRSIEGVDPAVVPEVRSVRILALLRLKRFPDAEHAIGEWLGRTPDDPFALSYAMQHGALLDDLDRIETPARKLIRLKKFVVQAANNLAWAKYCHGRFDDDAVQVAEITSRSGSAAAVNTLATLYAETGRLDQARQTALKSVDANGAFTDDGEIGFADRYALARIWEGYGLDDLAAAEYRKLSVSKGNDSPGGDCIAAAARRRLAGLSAVQ